MDKEHAHSGSFLMQVGLSSCNINPFSSRRPAVKDLTVAAALSLLIHLLVAVTVVFMPPARASQNAQIAYMEVDLVDVVEKAWGEADSGGSESADGAFAAPHLAETFNVPPEKTKAPVTAQTRKMTGKPKRPGSEKMKETKPGVHRLKKSNPGLGRTLAASISTSSYKPQLGSQDGANGFGQATALEWDEVLGVEQGGDGSANGGNPYEAGSREHEGPVSAVDKVPQPIQKYEPVYPDKARQLGISGKVVVKFVVEPDGHVSRASVQEAHPEGIFERSVLDAILRWRFNPGYLRGKPVATWVILPFEFQLT